jgi:excisionase family DNA binding protein
MEINAQDQTLAVPRHRDGGPQAGPRTSRDTAAKLQNETLDRTRLLTVEQVADLLHVQPSWVYGHTRRRAQDRIPGFRLGKYWRFSEIDVLRWVQRQRG